MKYSAASQFKVFSHMCMTSNSDDATIPGLLSYDRLTICSTFKPYGVSSYCIPYFLFSRKLFLISLFCIMQMEANLIYYYMYVWCCILIYFTDYGQLCCNFTKILISKTMNMTLVPIKDTNTLKNNPDRTMRTEYRRFWI